MKVPFVDLQAQYQPIKSEIDAAIRGVLERGDFILGRAVQEFEELFARYCGASHTIGVDSGLTAIELILRAYGIGPGDEVIAPANTFHSSVLPVSRCGARAVLVEPDLETYTIDPAQIEAAISPRTRAIIAVHFYGQPADMDPIMAIARRHNLRVIEDAAQAHGARYKGRRTGALGDAAAFSFYPTKNLGAYGDGGAVVTDDAELAEKIRLLRNLGQQTRNDHVIRGGNHRLDTLQAAVLKVNLEQLDARNAARQHAAELYAEALADLPLITPATAPDREHVYHLYVIRTPQRDLIQQHLSELGIANAIHYPVPIHLQPAFADLGYQAGAFPRSELLCNQILSLPMFPGLGADQIEYVASALRQFELLPAA